MPPLGKLVTRELVAIPQDFFTEEELKSIDQRKLMKAMSKAYDLGYQHSIQDTVGAVLT